MENAKRRAALRGENCSKPTAADIVAKTRDVMKKVWSRRLRTRNIHAQMIPIMAAKSQIGIGRIKEFIRA